MDIVERLRETAAEFESIGHDADELHEACDEIKRLRADYERVSHRQADLVCEVANLRTERDALSTALTQARACLFAGDMRRALDIMFDALADKE